SAMHTDHEGSSRDHLYGTLDHALCWMVRGASSLHLISFPEQGERQRFMDRSHDASSITPLRQERIRRNWRQQDLADQLGTTVATVKRWEQGSHLPGPYFRVKLCDLFGKSAEELGLLPDASPSPTTEDGTPFCLPFLRNPYFTGRESLVAHLRT